MDFEEKIGLKIEKKPKEDHKKVQVFKLKDSVIHSQLKPVNQLFSTRFRIPTNTPTTIHSKFLGPIKPKISIPVKKTAIPQK